jgi:hypothetical protein
METLSLPANVRHSSKSDAWRTPPDIVERARIVLGGIDLDPATTIAANAQVNARCIFAPPLDGLAVQWFGSVFLNPPGGVRDGKSQCGLWWAKLIEEIESERVKDAIFVAFSIEALQFTQRCERSILDFPFCVPRQRLAFLNGDGLPAKQPAHANAIVYVPGEEDNTEVFVEQFTPVGKVVY